jgi:hypothetical protein
MKGVASQLEAFMRLLQVGSYDTEMVPRDLGRSGGLMVSKECSEEDIIPTASGHTIRTTLPSKPGLN